MAYYIEPVDRDELPKGTHWAFMEGPDCNIRFLIARDAERVELPDAALRFLLERIATHTEVAEVLAPARLRII